MMGARILYIHGITEIGGAERDLLALLRRLDRSRWEPLVACPGAGSLAAELKAIDVPIHALTLPAWRKLREVPRRIPALFRTAQLVRTLRAAMIHVNDLWWAPLGCLVSKWCGVPCVVSVRQPLEPRRLRQYCLHWGVGVVDVTRSAAAVLVENGVPKQRIWTIPSGIDVDLFTPEMNGRHIRAQFGIPSDALVIGCVANVLPVKGYDVLIAAMAKVMKSSPSVHWLIVGRDDSTYGTEIRNLAGRLHLVEWTHFAGFQPDVRPYLAAMNLVVLPSRSEALGLALLEAMAMEKPVIASRVGGIPEIVEHGLTGLLVEPNDPDALAEALISLLEDPGRRYLMGQAGRQRVVAQFCLERTVAAMEQMYEEILAR